MINREFGSDFHLDACNLKTSSTFFDLKNTQFSSSGRSSLYALIKMGIEKYNWSKLYFPSYYCHDVPNFLSSLPIKIEFFSFNPYFNNTLPDSIIDKESHVLINVNYFGIRSISLPKFKHIFVIDDFTHCVHKIFESEANYCFGSLRKELPVPIGGFLYSRNKELPDEGLSIIAEKISLEKLYAMQAKNDYLEGKLKQKDIFRYHFMNAEEALAKEEANGRIPDSSLAILKLLDVNQIFKDKKRNLSILLSLLGKTDRVSYNFEDDTSEAFGLTVVLREKDQRDSLKDYLIQRNIYPAILWPGQSDKNDIDFQSRILFVHTDFRYNGDDMRFIASTLNAFLK